MLLAFAVCAIVLAPAQSLYAQQAKKQAKAAENGMALQILDSAD